MLQSHPYLRLPGEADGKHGVYHNRSQEEKPQVAVVFIKFEVCTITHQAARELKSRKAAAGKKDEYTQYDICYAESKYDGQGCFRVKKCIHVAPRY
jgi:hypothetical protein